jgi:ribose transport system permease protein
MVFVAENREVARLAGLQVRRIRAGALVATSTLGGLAGIVLAGTNSAANPQAGSSYLLPSFAAAFLGSTAIVPGRFNAWGSFVAVYFLVTGITGLQYLGYAGWPEQVFYGSSLVVAVTLSHLAGRRRLSGLL